MKEVDNLAKLIPDVFYDILAYIVPASVMCVGIILIVDFIGTPIKNFYSNITDAVDKIFIALFVLGLLYIVGQLITVCSYWPVFGILGAFSRLTKRTAWIYGSGKTWQVGDKTRNADQAYVAERNSDLRLEVMKRYTRMIMARNNTLVFLILAALALLMVNYSVAIICFMLFVLLLFEAYTRRVWFNNFLFAASTELRKLDAATKQETKGSLNHIPTDKH